MGSVSSLTKGKISIVNGARSALDRFYTNYPKARGTFWRFINNLNMSGTRGMKRHRSASKSVTTDEWFDRIGVHRIFLRVKSSNGNGQTYEIFDIRLRGDLPWRS
jgi:hypothetical protein